MKTPNSYKTRITDNATDKVLAEWVSTTIRSDEERQAIAADMYTVMTKEVK